MIKPSIEIGIPVAVDISNDHQSIRKAHPLSIKILIRTHRANFLGIGFSI